MKAIASFLLIAVMCSGCAFRIGGYEAAMGNAKVTKAAVAADGWNGLGLLFQQFGYLASRFFGGPQEATPVATTSPDSD